MDLNEIEQKRQQVLSGEFSTRGKNYDVKKIT